ncbi:MAG: DUF327 family protein, partial [Exilispira sp.]
NFRRLKIMIPSIYNILQKFSGRDQKKSGKLERAATIKREKKTFDQILFEKRVEDIILQYENTDPSTLISIIDEAGKKYKKDRNENDLASYKSLLASFIILCERKAYRIKIIKSKKDPLLEDEVDYIIVEIEKRLLALMESFILSQKQIIDLIDEVEGLIFKISV